MATKTSEIQKLSQSQAVTGEMGQRYLIAGENMAMRLWEARQVTEDKPVRARSYETVGYVLAGRAELQSEGRVILLETGDSWYVPKGASHTYSILEPFTAIEVTCPPARENRRDEQRTE